MPSSIQFVREVGTAPGLSKSISTAPNLAELLELVPAPYRPSMRDLVFKVYRAAVKSNNTRSYLTTLEKHEQEGDFPTEIGARIAAPALQISKEYLATAEYRTTKSGIDASVLEHKKDALSAAIKLKKAEVAYLQGLFAENTYTKELSTLLQTVLTMLCSDAGVSYANPDKSSAEASWPSWIKEDYVIMKTHGPLYPQRAVALAFTLSSAEMTRKMRNIALDKKKKADGDVEMDEDEDDPKTETVATVVQRELAKLLKENKLQNVGNHGQRNQSRNSSSKPKPKPNPQGQGKGKLPYKVGKNQGSRGNSQGGKGKGKKSNKK